MIYDGGQKQLPSRHIGIRRHNSVLISHIKCRLSVVLILVRQFKILCRYHSRGTPQTVISLEWSEETPHGHAQIESTDIKFFRLVTVSTSTESRIRCVLLSQERSISKYESAVNRVYADQLFHYKDSKDMNFTFPVWEILSATTHEALTRQLFCLSCERIR